MSFSEWTEMPLGDLVVAKYGKSLTKSKRIPGDYNVYGSGGISGTHNSPLVKGPGIIIGRKGTVGSVYYEHDGYYPIDTTYYIEESYEYSLEFIYYLLRNARLSEMNTHSAVPGLSRDNLYARTFMIPSKDEQIEIAQILTSIDYKIEVNDQIVKNLDGIAQGIFKEWFIDFEFPNSNDKSYKSSGGEMFEKETCTIPVGWDINSLDEIAEIVGGATPSKKKDEYFTDSGIPWVTPKDLSNNKNKFIGRGNTDITELGFKNSSTKLLPKGSILFSSRAPIGYIAIAKNDLTTNQGFKSLMPKHNVSNEFLFYLLRHLTPVIESHASGSTFKEISGKGMKAIKFVCPEMAIINKFHIIVESLSKRIESCEDENIRLTALRNTLLPKLMSGEIRVNDE